MIEQLRLAHAQEALAEAARLGADSAPGGRSTRYRIPPMQTPEEFGFSPTQSLAYVADPTLSRAHGPFWTRWDEAVFASEPRLRDPARSERDECAAGGATHVLESVRHTRIGARVTLPGGAPRAVVVTSHGYGVDGPMDDESSWGGAGIATVRVRVRGHPGSRLDAGDLTAHAGGWITHGLESLETWSLPLAVADVVNAVRAARAMFPGAPVGLHGESLGGGLAVIGAAMLEPHEPAWRLCAALPSLGAWRWRVRQQVAGGSGIQREVLDYLRAHAVRETEVRERLSVCDAAIHARRVRCPSLFKLATCDDVVPAPSAAAVFNALGVDAGLKWRFVTRYGHFDGGLADLRRHAAFERLLARWFDPREDVEALMHGVQQGGQEVAA